MAFWTPRRRLAGLLLLAVVLGTGCNPLLLPFFLFPSAVPKQPPKLAKLTPPQDRESAKVLIITSAPMNTGVDFAKIDRDLTSATSRWLTKTSEENKEKLIIIKPNKVECFKDDHPDWITMEKVDIGRRFNVDYVIYLEIETISLYEKGMSNLMLHGQASIGITLVDMQKPDEDPLTAEVHTEYPTKARGPIQADERNLQEFRHAFLESIAKQVAWHFTAHQMRDEEFGD